MEQQQYQTLLPSMSQFKAKQLFSPNSSTHQNVLFKISTPSRNQHKLGSVASSKKSSFNNSCLQNSEILNHSRNLKSTVKTHKQGKGKSKKQIQLSNLTQNIDSKKQFNDNQIKKIQSNIFNNKKLSLLNNESNLKGNHQLKLLSSQQMSASNYNDSFLKTKYMSLKHLKVSDQTGKQQQNIKSNFKQSNQILDQQYLQQEHDSINSQELLDTSKDTPNLCNNINLDICYNYESELKSENEVDKQLSSQDCEINMEFCMFSDKSMSEVSQLQSTKERKQINHSSSLFNKQQFNSNCIEYEILNQSKSNQQEQLLSNRLSLFDEYDNEFIVQNKTRNDTLISQSYPNNDDDTILLSPRVINQTIEFRTNFNPFKSLRNDQVVIDNKRQYDKVLFQSNKFYQLNKVHKPLYLSEDDFDNDCDVTQDDI